jgi:hypothetical protein
LLIYTLIKAKPSNIAHSLEHIQKYRYPPRLSGLDAYCLALLEQAVMFVDQLCYENCEQRLCGLKSGAEFLENCQNSLNDAGEVGVTAISLFKTVLTDFDVLCSVLEDIHRVQDLEIPVQVDTLKVVEVQPFHNLHFVLSLQIPALLDNYRKLQDLLLLIREKIEAHKGESVEALAI